MKKTTQFRQLLQSPELAFICEAHNGISAKIVEEAGFKGIWGSGLSISAAMGVRDNNEASWTQVLEVLEFMSDNTSVPLLLDGDTGYGNFNNMRRLVRKLEQRDVAAVCIEDKVFPKTNSFIKGETQPLAPMDEFAGKIKAGKDAQHDDDFCIVARTEAFIAGWGLEEALKRAEAYRQAGADAILVHSKIDTPTDIVNFMKEWDDRHPVVIVPTMYFSTPTQLFSDLGISMVIWANHILRSSIRAMQQTTSHLLESQNLMTLEPELPSVKEIFRLQGMEEYAKWEQIYLPKSSKPCHAILLAATKGTHFGSLTDEVPKAMLEVAGKPIIATGIQNLRDNGVRDITVVTGYKPDSFTVGSVAYKENARWEDTGELGSLLVASDKLQGKLLVGYGDVVTRPHVIQELVGSEHDFTVVVDYAKPKIRRRQLVDYALITPPPNHEVIEELTDVSYQLARVSPEIEPERASGEWIGMLHCSAQGTAQLMEAIDTLKDSGVEIDSWSLPQLLNHLIETGATIHVQFVHGNWLDIDDILDLSELYKF